MAVPQVMAWSRRCEPKPPYVPNENLLETYIVGSDRLAGEANNYYRLRRVVEILVASGGVPLAALDVDTGAALEYDFRCFFLDRPRTQLYRRIDQRGEIMLRDGVLQVRIPASACMQVFPSWL